MFNRLHGFRVFVIDIEAELRELHGNFGGHILRADPVEETEIVRGHLFRFCTTRNIFAKMGKKSDDSIIYDAWRQRACCDHFHRARTWAERRMNPRSEAAHGMKTFRSLPVRYAVSIERVPSRFDYVTDQSSWDYAFEYWARNAPDEIRC